MPAVSTEFPSLEQFMQLHHQPIDTGFLWSCSCGADFHDTDDGRDYPGHLADTWRAACTITTIEQLDALPGGAVVQSDTADIGDVHAKWPEHHLSHLYGPWFQTGYEIPSPSAEIQLPAQLIWHPDWSADG